MKKVQITEREKIMNGMMEYIEGKKHVQIISRAFLAGVRFGKNLNLES